jgi:protein SCO1/2
MKWRTKWVLIAALLAAGGLLLTQGGSRRDAGNAVVAGGFAAVFPKSDEMDYDPPPPGSYALPAIKAMPDGMLLDWTGRERSLNEALAGKLSLVSFIYLSCSDENGCPAATATLFEIHERSLAIPSLRENVRLVTISFDPERDTVEAMESFRYSITIDKDAARKIEWLAFTGRSEADIRPVIDGFGQAVNRSPNSDVINHLLRLYLVDRSGAIRNIYGLGQIDPRLMMTDVETLLMEEGTLQKPVGAGG